MQTPTDKLSKEELVTRADKVIYEAFGWTWSNEHKAWMNDDGTIGFKPEEMQS